MNQHLLIEIEADKPDKLISGAHLKWEPGVTVSLKRTWPKKQDWSEVGSMEIAGVVDQVWPDGHAPVLLQPEPQTPTERSGAIIDVLERIMADKEAHAADAHRLKLERDAHAAQVEQLKAGITEAINADGSAGLVDVLIDRLEKLAESEPF